MEANYVHKDSTTLEEKSQVFTRWIDPTIKELKQENQELKQKYLNAVSDYETTMAEKNELNSLVNSCQEEIRQLKKQLEEYKHKGLYNTCLSYSTGYKKAIKEKETQQKEFISYLESEIDRLEKTEFYIDSIQKAAIETHKHNLSKYKEIIGGKE